MQVSQSANERVPEASAKTDTKRISASSATFTKVLEDAIATNVLYFCVLLARINLPSQALRVDA
jgi:hypothetical protein